MLPSCADWSGKDENKEENEQKKKQDLADAKKAVQGA